MQSNPVPLPDQRPPSQGIVGGQVPPSGILAPPVPNVAPQPAAAPPPVTPVVATKVEAKQPPAEETPSGPAAISTPDGQKRKKKKNKNVSLGGHFTTNVNCMYMYVCTCMYVHTCGS